MPGLRSGHGADIDLTSHAAAELHTIEHVAGLLSNPATDYTQMRRGICRKIYFPANAEEQMCVLATTEYGQDTIFFLFRETKKDFLPYG